jgi:hypothetical protein
VEPQQHDTNKINEDDEGGDVPGPRVLAYTNLGRTVGM